MRPSAGSSTGVVQNLEVIVEPVPRRGFRSVPRGQVTWIAWAC